MNAIYCMASPFIACGKKISACCANNKDTIVAGTVSTVFFASAIATMFIPESVPSPVRYGMLNALGFLGTYAVGTATKFPPARDKKCVRLTGATSLVGGCGAIAGIWPKSMVLYMALTIPGFFTALAITQDRKLCCPSQRTQAAAPLNERARLIEPNAKQVEGIF